MQLRNAKVMKVGSQKYLLNSENKQASRNFRPKILEYLFSLVQIFYCLLQLGLQCDKSFGLGIIRPASDRPAACYSSQAVSKQASLLLHHDANSGFLWDLHVGYNIHVVLFNFMTFFQYYDCSYFSHFSNPTLLSISVI